MILSQIDKAIRPILGKESNFIVSMNSEGIHIYYENSEEYKKLKTAENEFENEKILERLNNIDENGKDAFLSDEEFNKYCNDRKSK